ncbi:MAG: glycosyltransferase family 4 protein [Labilibaculum sp.]|nr:glycosyltransferase family 4 protein [Labilibaculum sp.]MBI9059640.1 glycosyltransferase family 4 protein [Labilibaculum sp.]
MKICFFIGYYPLLKGGAEYQAKLLATELNKENEVFFISVGHDTDEILDLDGIKVYTLKINRILDRAFLYYPTFRKIQNILNREEPSLIYQRVLDSFSFHLSKYVYEYKIPYYLHIADEYSLRFPSTLSGRVRYFFFKSIIKTQVQFIVQTDNQKELLSYYGIKPILKIYNLHPDPDSKPSKESKDCVDKSILWIGSARMVKRMEKYLDIANSYKDFKSFKFYIIGRIEQGKYGDTLINRIKQMSNVIYLGENENDYVNNMIVKSDILVNTSDSEGFSNTFIQAWLRGVPVVSLNSNPDGLMDKYELGYHCNGDMSMVTKCVYDLLHDNFTYNRISNNSYLIAKQLFSLDNNISQFKEILNH